MADNLGSIAWLFLQENVLPQWQQKIALRAENPFGHKCFNVEEQKALKGR